jgi:hypothetical protein
MFPAVYDEENTMVIDLTQDGLAAEGMGQHHEDEENMPP